MTAEQILLREMRSYYSADKLTVGPDFVEEHVEQIADSAERMRSAASLRGLERLVELLRELEKDRRHPLHKRLEKTTQRSWSATDEMFGTFQQLVDAWIKRLTGVTGKTPRQILLGELGAYYLGDELRVSPELMTEYAGWIADSARRLRTAAGERGIDGLATLLRELRENRSHPLFEQIGARTMFNWEADDETFAIFQQLADRWIENLTRATPAPERLELREVTYDYGNEHDPGSSIGRFIVTLSSDASLRLTHHRRGQRREWQGKQAASVWPDVLAHLSKARFPIAPHVEGMVLPPGTTSFTVSARDESGEILRVQAPSGVPLDGYRELSLLMMNIVAQVCGDILGFALPPEPRLLTEVAP